MGGPLYFEFLPQGSCPSCALRPEPCYEVPRSRFLSCEGLLYGQTEQPYACIRGWAESGCPLRAGAFAGGFLEEPLQRCGGRKSREAVLSPGLPLAKGRGREGTLRGEGAALERVDTVHGCRARHAHIVTPTLLWVHQAAPRCRDTQWGQGAFLECHRVPFCPHSVG